MKKRETFLASLYIIPIKRNNGEDKRQRHTHIKYGNELTGSIFFFQWTRQPTGGKWLSSNRRPMVINSKSNDLALVRVIFSSLPSTRRGRFIQNGRPGIWPSERGTFFFFWDFTPHYLLRVTGSTCPPPPSHPPLPCIFIFRPQNFL